MGKRLFSLLLGASITLIASVSIVNAAGTSQDLNFSANHDSITFYIDAKAPLSENGEYVATCNTANSGFADSRVTERSVEPELTLENLKPETEYSCTVRTLENKIVVVDNGPIQIKTTKRLRIIESKQGIDWVTITVNDVPLQYGEKYFVGCHLNGDESAISPYVASDSTTITVEYLDWYSDFTCQAGIGTDISKFNVAKVTQFSENTVDVTTRGKEDITPDPTLDYTAPLISDWEEYNHPYADVDPNSKWGDATAELYRRGIINGHPDGEFKGSQNINRAEASKLLLLARYKQVPNIQNNYQFLDVHNQKWYTKYVMMAAYKDIIHGYEDGLFRPANTVNTAEFIKMITRTFNLPQDLPYDYQDVPKNHWYAKYAGITQKMNLFPDRKEHLFPQQELSRYEVALALYQALKYIEENGTEM